MIVRSHIVTLGATDHKHGARKMTVRRRFFQSALPGRLLEGRQVDAPFITAALFVNQIGL